MIIVDFETRSRVNLIKYGAYAYARSPSTEVICCHFMKAGDPALQFHWRNTKIYYSEPVPKLMPQWLLNALEDSNIKIAAHNAQFDRLIWDYIAEPDHNFPYIEYDRWYCTASMCRVNALPGNLDDATRATNTKHKKDFEGKRLIRKLSIPQDDGKFCEDQTELAAMTRYCIKDVLATNDLMGMCRPMTQSEHKDWLLSEDINDRGIGIDIDLATYAMEYAIDESNDIAKKLSMLTDGRVTRHTQTARMSAWLQIQLNTHNITTDLMIRHKDGKKRMSLDKSVRAEYLDRAVELGLPGDVIEALQLMDDGNRSSVAKFQKMLLRSDNNDHRVRGAFVYAGASQTLRYASRGVQLHNMRRDTFSAHTTNFIKSEMKLSNRISNMRVYEPDLKLPIPGMPDDGPGFPSPPAPVKEVSLGTTMDVLSKLLRPTIIPAKGHLFVVGDWKSIEAMGLPWLSGEDDAERVLDVFRSGRDLYEQTAEDLGVEDRQIGKVATLSLGFGGAVGAFGAMCRAYGVSISESAMRMVVSQWRDNNPWAGRFWHRLERAAKLAIENPNTWYEAGKVKYYFEPGLLGGTLMCVLPGDVCLQYPYAKLEIVDTPYGPKRVITAMKAGWTMASDAKEWPRIRLWHGLLAENADQGFCAGILRDTMRRWDGNKRNSDMPIIMHVHDEIVLEVPKEQAYAAQSQLKMEMEAVPLRLRGLPLQADVSVMTRYGIK